MSTAIATNKVLYQPWQEEVFLADYRIRTLTAIQKWMYRSLLQSAFNCSERPDLPDDDALLWIYAGCESREQWETDMEPVRAMFTPVVGVDGKKLLRHKRLVGDWERARKTQLARAESGRKGGHGNGANHSGTTEANDSGTSAIHGVARESENGDEVKGSEGSEVRKEGSKEVVCLASAKQLLTTSPAGGFPAGQISLLASESGLDSPASATGIPSNTQPVLSGSPRVIVSGLNPDPEGSEFNNVETSQFEDTAKGLMRAVGSISAEILHRTTPAFKNQEEKFDLIRKAYSFNVVTADFREYCRETLSEGARYPIADYVKVVDQRLGSPCTAPSINVKDPRISGISGIVYERTGYLPAVRSVAVMLSNFPPEEITDAVLEYAGTLDEKEYKSAMSGFFAGGGSAVIITRRRRHTRNAPVTRVEQRELASVN